MVYGHIEEAETYNHLIRHSVWKQAFNWIRAMPAQPELGIHPIIGDEMYANIMQYSTVGRNEARFESHRKNIDLQFTITGGEVIDWRLARSLAPDGGYEDSKDLQFYLSGESLTSVHMLPGNFGIFFPQDAHRPKVADGRHQSVFKGVIKINRTLLES